MGRFLRGRGGRYVPVAGAPDRSAMSQVRGWEPKEPAAGNGAAGRPVALGRCRCGAAAEATCEDGCGAPTSGPHLRPGSCLAQLGPYQSEREHTAYLRAFGAAGGGRCRWCREEAGAAAVAGLAPVAALPAGAVDRLCALVARPHDHPADAWDRTIAEHGGAAGTMGLLAARLFQLRVAQSFPGRRRAGVLTGVVVGHPASRACREVVDAAGGVWELRRATAGAGTANGTAWRWGPVSPERLRALVPVVVGELLAADGPTPPGRTLGPGGPSATSWGRVLGPGGGADAGADPAP